MLFKWRFLPYLSVCVDRFLDCDPAELQISANYSEEVPSALRLLMHNNYLEIFVLFVAYIHLAYKCNPKGEHLGVTKILNFIRNAVTEMRTCSSVILDNVLHNILTFFVNLFKVKSFESISVEF